MMGLTSGAECRNVRDKIKKHPEIKAAYDRLKLHIDNLDQHIEIDTPKSTKEAILRGVYHLERKNWRKSRKRLLLSISFLLFAMIILSLVSYITVQRQESHGLALEAQTAMYKKQKDQVQEQLNLQNANLSFLKNPDTRKYIMQSADMKACLYWNTKDKLAFIHVIEMAEARDLQIYYKIPDGYVLAGNIHESTDELQPIDFVEEASLLVVTPETSGDAMDQVPKILECTID